MTPNHPKWTTWTHRVSGHEYDEYQCPVCEWQSDGDGSPWPDNCGLCATKESVCPACGICLECKEPRS